MPRRAGTSAKAERDQLRDRMHGLGCSIPQIAAEMGRRFNLRPRLAWRQALGWPQWKLAQEYNSAHPGARLSDRRVSEYESWPHGGSPPSLRYLARLATTYGHGCTPSQLVDADDLDRLIPADRCLLTTSGNGYVPAALTTAAPSRSPRRDTVVPTLPANQSGLEPAASAEASVWAAVMALQLPDTLAALLMTSLGSSGLSDCAALVTPRERDHAYHLLVQFLRSWAHTMDRRDMFLAQRNLARALVPECAAVLRPRMLSALSEASRQAGWLSFDLKQFDDAGYYTRMPARWPTKRTTSGWAHSCSAR